MRIHLYFIRHGLSCANAIGWYGNKPEGLLKRTFFNPDPPLTQYSRDVIRHTPPTPLLNRVDVVLSSTLLRALETALLTFPKKKVYVVPYVKETGMGSSNMPQSVGHHAAHLTDSQRKRVNYRFALDKNKKSFIPGAYKADFPAFLQWLTQHLPTLLHLKPQKNRKEFHIAIVSHSRFIQQSLAPSISEVPFNNAVIVKQYEYKRKDKKEKELISIPCPLEGFRTKNAQVCGGVLFVGFPPPSLAQWKEIVKQGGADNCDFKNWAS